MLLARRNLVIKMTNLLAQSQQQEHQPCQKATKAFLILDISDNQWIYKTNGFIKAVIPVQY